MRLTQAFTSEKQIVDTSGKGQSVSIQNTGLVNRQIHALVPGQTIQGELVARNGSEVQIRLADDVVIKARLEQNMNLEIGKTVTFEVKNNGQSLLLSPLYANVATDANVLKALDMASLPITPSTVEMTELLMQSGLSINRNALQQVFRESNLFANADIKNIVDLHKLALPVNESNLSQIASYKNLTHQLVNGLNNCLDILPDTIQDMMQKGDYAGAQKLYQELLHMIGEAGNAEAAKGLVSIEGVDQILTQISNGQNPALIQTADGQMFVLLPPTEGQGQMFTFSGDGQLLEALLQPENSQLLQQLAQGDDSQLLQTVGQNQDAMGWNGAPLMQELVKSGNIQMLQELLQNGDGKLLQLLAQAGNGAEQGAQLQTLSGFLKSNLQNLWTITPEAVADPKQVEQLYGRLDRQLKSLTQVLENVNQTSSQAYQSTVTLSQNIDFLQQLNQAYTYVQLPLRLQQGNNAHGELFVYTNKKHLAAKDGQISALLHLDMEHLGPIDVYVAMQNQNVSTKFYLQDDEMLDFLSEHMELLTERLKQRGYNCNYEMLTRGEGEEKPKSGIHEIIQANGHVPVVQYAFDVRT